MIQIKSLYVHPVSWGVMYIQATVETCIEYKHFNTFFFFLLMNRFKKFLWINTELNASELKEMF